MVHIGCTRLKGLKRKFGASESGLVITLTNDYFLKKHLCSAEVLRFLWGTERILKYCLDELRLQWGNKWAFSVNILSLLVTQSTNFVIRYRRSSI